MTTQCISCVHADLQSNKAMSKEEFVLCKANVVRWRFYSLTYVRECAKHRPAGGDVEQKRRTWWARTSL